MSSPGDLRSVAWTYRFVRRLTKTALGFYYRSVEVEGRRNLPKTGPVLLLANHHISMVDPLLLIAASRRPVQFIAKAPLFRVPILSFFLRRLGCIPAYRSQDPGYQKEKNLDLYQSVAEAFRSGGAVGIFPEGRSHEDPSLGEFKHGAAKMALEAEAASGFSLGLRVLLVGIHFERTRLFRGRVLVTLASPMTLEGFRELHAADPRGAVESLTRTLHERLSKMVLDAETEEAVRLAARVESLGILPDDDKDLRSKFDRRKFILEEYRRLLAERPEEVQHVRSLVRRYDRILSLVGGRDGHVTADYRVVRILGFTLKNALLLAIGAPFLAVGILLNAVPFWLVRLLAIAAYRKEGRGADVRAGVGLLLAIVIFPPWYATLAWWGWKNLDPWIWIPVLSAGPPCGLLAMGWLERWRKVARETSALLLAVFRPAARGRLRRMRDQIRKGIERLRGESAL